MFIIIGQIVPIFLPLNHTGGTVSIMEVVIITAIILYAMQLLFVVMNVVERVFDNKQQFFWWCVPFIPAIVHFVKKVIEL